MENKNKRFEVKEIDDHFKVWDNKSELFITVEVPERWIAEEIMTDFEAMSDYMISVGKDF